MIVRRLSSALAAAGLLLGLGVPAGASEIVHLSGTSADETVEWAFRCSDGSHCGTWATIPVPSNWELQGFGRYDYGRQDRKTPESGEYRHEFVLPPHWADRRVDLVFEGVMTDAEVRVNGEPAGPVHRGGFYRFRYDVTDLLRHDGANRLEVLVHEASADRSVNRAERDADYWVFGGIYRPVYLEAFPRRSIREAAIDARADGRLTVDLRLDGIDAPGRVVGRVLDATGDPVGEPFRAELAAGETVARLAAQFDGIRTWSAETPILYRLELCLDPSETVAPDADRATGCGGRRPVHRRVESFGFRTVELRPGSGFYVNGVRVRLKGINRHSFWPSTGRTTTPEISRRDVELIRSMNLNAVRMSHYPPDTHFLEACDELGLYVLDELAGWKEAYDTGVGRPLVESMVVRDRNHPSVIAWNNGNEGGWNAALDEVFRRHDPQGRVVLHPDSDEPFAGLQTRHYRSYDVLAGYLDDDEDDSVVLPTEFLHGLFDGGSGAGLADYWALLSGSPRGAGGFLWALFDEGVVRVDRGGEIDVAGNLAPDGVVGPYRQPEASVATLREIFAPVELLAPRSGVLDDRFDGILRIANRHDFTDLSTLRIDWRLLDLPSPWTPTPEPAVAAQGTVRPPASAPGTEARIDLGLPPDWRRHDALAIDAVAADGRVVRSWSLPLRSVREVRRGLVVGGAQPPPVQRIESAEAIRLIARDVEVAIDRGTGELIEVRTPAGPVPLTGGPRLGDATPVAVDAEARADGDAQEVGVRYRDPLRSAWWRLEPSGWLRLRYRYEVTGERQFHGIGFTYPRETVRAIRWLGLGPHRVWRNRTAGPTHGVWELTRNDAITGERWDYPEFPGYFGDVYWMRWSTDAGPLTVAFDRPGRFVQNFTPSTPEDPMETRVAFPPHDISFPWLIPAIGTKFHPPEDLGPSGRPVEALGAYGEDLWIYFGEPPGSAAAPEASASPAAASDVDGSSSASSVSGQRGIRIIR